MLRPSEELAMPRSSWSGEVSRKIVRRIVVEGDLVLQTPAHLGNGDGNNLVDMPLLTDPLDEKTPLLTGASIAGALRGYLHERENGFRAKVITEAEAKNSPIVLLFGGNRGYDYGEQSPLIVSLFVGTESLHNIWIGSAAQLFGTIFEPIQQLRSICQVVFFDAPARYAYLAIAAPLSGTNGDAAIVETGKRCSQRLFER